MSELIKNIPVVALRGMTILPSMITHFDISREKSVKAVEAAMLRDQRLVVLTQKSPETQDPGMKDLYKIGTLVTVKQIMKLPQDIFRVLAEGLERVEVMDLDVADGCLVADAATFSEEELALPDEKNQEAMVQTLRTIFQNYCQANSKISRETALQIMEQTDLQKMVGEGDVFSYYGPVFSSTYVAAEANLTPEELAQSIGFALFPKSEKNETPFCVAAPQAVSVNANTEYPEICKALLEEVYAGDAVKDLAVHGDTIFSLTSVTAANEMEEITTNPILESIGYMADYVVTTPPVEGESVFRDELFKQIVLLELGQVTPEKAFEDFKIQVELNVDEDEVVFELN